MIVAANYSHLKNIQRYNKFYTFTIRALTTNAKEKIKVPYKVHREPTDLLRALESTIRQDTTASHYKFHDDPFLIPMSNIGKRTFALAQEAGRKAAHWVREQHPDLFQHKECDPPINVFFPKGIYDENSAVTEEDLNKLIEEVLVSDAVTVYNLLKTKGVDISKETLQSFLELLCFYNNEDTLQEEFIEERWYKRTARGKERNRKTWKDGALAEEIFISIEEPSAEAYSALIQGMGKYHQADRAWQLFEEAQQKNLILGAQSYNAIIKLSYFLKENYELRWAFVKEILSSMDSCKVKPNIGTLNAILEIISTTGINRQNKLRALATLKEFQLLGIEPSLGSWYYILITYCKETGPISYILKDIMLHLENKEHKIRDIADSYFFLTAMDVSLNHLNDRELGIRVHKLLHVGNNYDLLGDSFKESIYYRHYFTLMCNSEPLDEFMENIYEKLVPHIYVPESSVFEVILRAVEANDAVHYLPKLWSDMIIFDHIGRENLILILLDLMIINPNISVELDERFCTIARGIWEKVIDIAADRTPRITITGDLIGQIMVLTLRGGDFNLASKIMNKLDKDLNKIVGVPRIEHLSLFVDHCIQNKAPTKALQCIQYCSDCGFIEQDSFAIKLAESLTLDDEQLERLTKIIGPGVITIKEKEVKKKR